MTWRDNLQPASFRGVPFFVEGHELEVGRRLVTSEFPGSNSSYSEDLGRRARGYRVEGYLLGDDYMALRDRMLAACEQNSTSGALIHPWLGRIKVFCVNLRIREEKDSGGECRLGFEFVEDGAPPAPVAASDTSSGALSAVSQAVLALKTAMNIAYSVAELGIYAANAGAAILGAAIGGLIGLAAIPPSFTASAFALASTAASTAGLIDAIMGYGDAAVAYLASGTAPSLSSSAVSLQRDPSGGLIGYAAGFAAANAVLPPMTTPDRIAQGVNQQAILDLVAAATALSVAGIYAQSDFDSADAAQAARDQAIALFAGPIDRAADTGADDLYGALMEAQAACLSDIATRGSALSPLLQWTENRPRGALTLARKLYPAGFGGSSTETSLESAVLDLINRNSVVHPCFMPVSGAALAA